MPPRAPVEAIGPFLGQQQPELDAVSGGPESWAIVRLLWGLAQCVLLRLAYLGGQCGSERLSD